MTGRQSDKYSMLLVTLRFLKESDAATLSKMPHFLVLLEAFETMTETMRQLKIGQALDGTGIRISKLQLRAEMTALGMETAVCLAAYALSINDRVLEQEVTFKEYLLNKYRQTTIADTCRFIHKKAEGLLSELSDFGITEASLAALNAAIDDYDEMIPKTRSCIVKRMCCTEEIKELFVAFDTILKRMDGLVNMLRMSTPVFYTTYFGCRKIVTHGTRKLALRGVIKDENGNAIDGVEVMINTTPRIITKSGEKGHYVFKRLPGGVWPITFSRFGFVSETIYMAITPLLPQEFNILLKKEEILAKQA